MHRGSWLVVVFSLASLAGLPPARQVEPWLATLLLPFDGLVARARPAQHALAERDQLELDAQAAWEAWLGALGDRARGLPRGRRTAALSVLRHDERRGELVLRAGDAPLEVGSPVTHRGVLVGFVAARSSDGRQAVRDGEARVALVGGPGARPVAATWRAGDDGVPAHFLLAGGHDGPRIEHKSREFDGRLRPLVTTRDVSALGDPLPGGLLLGHLEPLPLELPGGGVGAGGGERFTPLLDPARLAWVAVEVPAEWSPEADPLAARMLSSPIDGASLLLDRGALDGVSPGDLVVQGGVLVGRVTTVAPITCSVARSPDPGTVLVAFDDGRVVPVDPANAAWPVDAPDRAGLPVFGGESGWGGLALGRVASPSATGFAVEPLPVDRARPVSVLRR